MFTWASLGLRWWAWRSIGRAFVAALFCAALLINGTELHASLTVLVGEPFDGLGKALPVGHTTVYLDRVCADGPLKVRMCEAGEQAGVAIARYYRLGQYDWIASPMMQFLYAADRAEDVLPYATPELVAGLQEQYRRRFLAELFPAIPESVKADEEWRETAGMAYGRRFWGYRLATTTAQDEHFVSELNARPNRHAYKAYTANCANFAAELVNIYFPKLVRRNRMADLGFMLPKQVAKSVYLYGRAHPEAELEIFEIPQVPGTITRSWRVRGGAETFLKTKRYLPLLVAQPELAAVLGALYLDHGRWELGKGAVAKGPEAFEGHTAGLVAAR